MKNRIIVSVSDAKVSNSPNDVLATYSLGSCIGVCLYDGSAGVGGMLHYQLPNSTQDPECAKKVPYMFADTGMKCLVDKLISMGAKKDRIKVKIAGGSAMEADPRESDIGKRNHLALRKILWKNRMFIDSEDVGGSGPRNMFMNIATGAVTIRSGGLEKNL